jgi:hypothetical protein
MLLAWRIACILEVVCAFGWRKGSEELADGGADCFDGAGCGGLSQQMFELG